MQTTICAGCGHANAVGARFCANCGDSLAATCASCGAPLDPSANFCSNCGAAVMPEPAALAEGSLKVVSVVFADLVGSTALQEAIDAESVRRVMARFYEAMRSVVARYEGQIQKFIGDAVVVVFGAPAVREDDALRAVRCAAAMAGELGLLNDELEQAWGVRLRMRTGVNTGELVVNNEGIFVGDTMNTAARLEQAAGAGEVLIGEATYRLVRHRVQLEEVARLELKGKTARVKAWRLVSVAPEATASAAEAPLVGRLAELERLREGLNGAVSERACQLVTVIGSPGLGKSRLAHEFALSVRAQARVLEGHCEPSGEGITFLPVAEVLRAAADVGETDAPETVIEKLAATVAEDPERDHVVKCAAAVLGASEPGSAEETFWGVRRVLEALARERPLVVVLDDLHWGQPMFLDLIEHLVEWVRDAPLLLVALARPELREEREALTSAGRRASDVIELEPLDSGESRELVDGLLGSANLGDQLLGRILETTEGNPLFLSELLRMLVDEGALERDGEVWVASGGAQAVDVPPTIQALLTARIERLRADERSVVERAAVIGQQFYRGAVAELVAPPVRSGIDGHLETLRRKDIVEPEGTYWIDEPVYRFHHVLIRDAAYHLLLKEARAELHEKFADWLAAKAGALVGEHEEVIAYHLEQAYDYRRQLGPLDDRGRAIGDRAAELLWSAGRRALAREDLAAAANLLQRAHDCGADDSVLWDLAEALLSAGDTAAANLVVEGLSGPRRAVLETQLAVLTGTGADLARVIAATEELAATDDGVGAAKGHHVTAQVQAQLGQVADVEASLDRALLAARRAGDRRRITAVLAAAPRAALWGPSPVVRASGRCLDVVRILRMTPGNRHVEAIALRCQAVLEAMRGRAEAARDILAAGRTTLEELGLTLELHELAVHAGIVELLDGRPQTAEALLRPAREGFATLGVAVSAGQAAALLARALVEQGRDEDAIAETEFAEQRGGGDLKTRITWCGVRAEALARRGALDEAVALARRAVALAEPTDALADKADANMALARVLIAAGSGDEARAVTVAAQRLYKEKDHVVGVTLAERLAGAPAETAAPSPASGRAVSDPVVAELLRRFDDAWRERDVDALLELYPPGEAVVDHRQLGWARLRDERWGRAVADVVEMWDDVRIDIDEVVASAEGVVALRISWRGRSSMTGGEMEVPLGAVMVIRDGRMVSLDYYEPDDREAMRARFEELTGTGSDLGDRPPERWLARWIERYGSHDRDGLRELWARDCVFIDHREMAWEELRGRDALMAVTESTWDVVPDNRCEVDEVLACDEQVIAVACTFRGTAADGGGPTEIAFGWVQLIENGVCARVEQFAHDDRARMLARYRELGGTEAALGDRPPERLIAEHIRRFNQHEPGRVAELAADGFSYADHRPLPIRGHRGRQIYADAVRSVLHLAPDIRVRVEEVLACDDRVIALRALYGGTNPDGGGVAEQLVGEVWAVRDGRLASLDQYEPDDGKMLARYAELGGGQGKLGDSAPEQWWREVLCAYARTDLDRLVELYAEDWVYADHRQLGWDEMRGQQDVRGFWRSALELTSSQYGEIDEVVACDERVIAVRLTWHGAANDGGGQLALPLCNVSVIENGRAVITEQYGPEETDALLSRYAELGGDLTVVLGDRPAERLFADRVRRFNAHDVDGSLALVCDDFAYCDHRTISTPDMRGREPLAQLIASIFDIAPGVRMDLEEVIASDGTVIAVRTAYRGGSAGPGIGDYEVVNTEVWLMREGTFAECHLFGADDRQAAIARYAELGGGLAKLGRTKPERWWYEYAQHYAAGDRDAVLAMHADGILLDHRELGWESTPAVDEVMAIIDGALAGTSDIRIEVDEVLASDERACALRITWRGTEASHGGLWEVPMGVVTAIEDGRSTHYEQFQPDDRQAMLARYRELAEQRPVLRWIESYLRAWNAHDLDAVVAHLAEAYVHHDQRRLGLWGSVRGRDAWRREIRPTFSAGSDARLQCTEVLAHDEQVAACIWSFTGTWRGGPYESTMAMLLTVEDGLLTESEFLDPEDRQAVIARYAELGGGRGPLGDRPPEQHVAEFIKRHARHDIDGMLELYRSDAVIVDHRGIGWEEVRGHQGLRELTRSAYDAAWDLHVEIDEVLACDDRVIAMLWTWRASTSTDGGGAMEIPVGRVAIVDNGKFVRIDQYDPDDRAAMMARYAELGGPREVLGDSPVERLVAEASRSFNEHDFDRHLLQHAEDFVLVDHRSIGWSEVRGRQAFGELVRSALAASADVRFDIDEVIASDGERVIALRGAWRSEGSGKAGAWEIPIGYVTVFKNGLLASHDFYEYDDTYAMRARFAELSGGSHPRGTASDDAFNRRDVDAMAESYAEDVVLVDHRRAGWDSVEGREAVLEQATSIWQHMSDDIQVVSQEVIAFDGRVFARIASYRGTARDGGGELDLALGQVGLMSGNQISRLEWFEPSDRWAMTARYAELGGGVAALGDRPPERVYAEFLRRWAAGDTEKILELCAEDYVHVDHRHLGWEPVETREGFRQFVTSVIGATSGFHCNVDEVLACDERLIAMRTTWRGHSTETASELEFKFGYVVIAEQGLVVRQDYYNHDDTDGMLSRYAELGGTRELRGERPPERFWARFVERFDAHDVDALLALRSADWVQVDHRQLGWGESRGRAAAEQLIRSAFAASPDVRLKIDEVIACDDRVSVIVGAWRGSNVDGGGDVAIPIGVVAVIENGTLQREELYEPEQRQEMIARYVELGGGAGPLGDRAPERWWKQFQSAYASGDVDRLIELQADDLENADHRGLAWEQLHGKEDIARFWASPFEVSDSIHVDVEQLLACDDRVIAVLVTYRGTGKDGGGQFSIPLGSVSVIENGRRVSMDIYESDDRERMLARFAELSAPAPVRIMTEYLRCLTAGDLEGALTVVADDFQLTDRRDLALWDDLRGHDGIQRLWASLNDPEIKVRGDLARVIACDEHIIAHTVRLSGTAIQAGDYELELGSVSVFEGGKWMRCEMYEPTDVRGMLARYAELTSTTEPEPPPLRAMREYVRYWDAADADAASAMFAEDVTILDHRRVGGDPIVGREAHRAFLSGAFELSPDNQMRIDDVIACDERVVAVCTTFGGTSPATGGGRAEVSLVQVRVYEGGLFTRSEMFEPDDRRAIVARYAELGGGTSRLGNRPPEQQVKKYATLFAGRDVEGLLQLHDEHWTLTDHRQLAWDEAQGLEQMAEILRSGFELSTDMRLEVDEVLACDERAIAMRVTWRGTAVDGGGQLDYPLGLVIVVEDGRAISHDQYDHDDTDAILARFAELSGPSRSVAAMD